MNVFWFNNTAYLLLAWLTYYSFSEDLVTPTRKRFYGDKVLRLVPITLKHQKWLQEQFLNGDPNAVDFWTEPFHTNVPVDVHVKKNVFDLFRAKLEALELNFTITIHDLQKIIDDVEGPALRRQRRTVASASLVSSFAMLASVASYWNRTNQGLDRNRGIIATFPRYDEIVSYVNRLCRTNPMLATCGSVGKTFEGRDIAYIQLGASTGEAKQQIIIEAGIHAREWLAPATAIYFINRLVTTYNIDETATRMLDMYDFVFVPSANPDGYEYSQVTDRLWRKTRSKISGSSCIGADPNRNYDAYWGSAGSSSDPCSDVFRGSTPFSEPETKAMSTFLSARTSQALAFFSLHTFGQAWLIPYGDEKGHYPPDYNEMLRVANIGTRAVMAANSQKWETCNTAILLGPAAGGTDDWTKLVGIKYAYTLELRPYGFVNGFIVAENQVIPSGREVWAGIMAAIDAIESGPDSNDSNNYECIFQQGHSGYYNVFSNNFITGSSVKLTVNVNVISILTFSALTLITILSL